MRRKQVCLPSTVIGEQTTDQAVDRMGGPAGPQLRAPSSDPRATHLVPGPIRMRRYSKALKQELNNLVHVMHMSLVHGAEGSVSLRFLYNLRHSLLVEVCLVLDGEGHRLSVHRTPSVAARIRGVPKFLCFRPQKKLKADTK